MIICVYQVECTKLCHKVDTQCIGFHISTLEHLTIEPCIIVQVFHQNKVVITLLCKCYFVVMLWKESFFTCRDVVEVVWVSSKVNRSTFCSFQFSSRNTSYPATKTSVVRRCNISTFLSSCNIIIHIFRTIFIYCVCLYTESDVSSCISFVVLKDKADRSVTFQDTVFTCLECCPPCCTATRRSSR